MPTPKLPWYQFSLRSLLLLTLFVAVLCSLGVCTHWFVSAVVVMLVLAGVAGRIVAGTRVGYPQGFAFGIVFLLGTGLACMALFRFLLPWESLWFWGVVLGVAALIGGIVGGFMVRPRPK
jgi:hypothetical protein